MSNQAYGSNNPVTPITSAEIDNMRQKLFENISTLNGNKYRLRPDEFHQLLNYHHYALTILDNMKVISAAEMNDPYNRNIRNVVGSKRISNIETINPYENQMQVVYQRDGRAKFVDKSNPNGKFKGEWEQQFNEGVLNPPCFAVPPSNLWGLPQK
jgi:hypothetical protein